MKRTSKNLVAFGLILFFAFGIWWTAFASPAQSLASVTGCSQTNRVVEMPGCDHFSYLCGFNSSFNLLSQGVVNSARANDLCKSVNDLFIREVPFSASKEATLIGKSSEDIFLVHKPHKVSTRLFNSIQNL